ncbi:TonB-dependent receptor [Asticcacaulis sp. AND118]|uniref:TonB-dependent receptor n=1 Tax=Asticcacaulis sp. AND118 TaxID=2840468 RepID=UPI001CFFAAC7|nr:TonB-dependent receptor [Asticcacaulis sp. AND118]UDF04050.1 TonB-dependent receptor [Asticcacaulis sp. AND118]
MAPFTKRFLVSLCLASISCGSAAAQEPLVSLPAHPERDEQERRSDETPASSEAQTEMPTVTVKGEKPKNRIDRQTYNISDMPNGDIGTVEDALKKIPGVMVDGRGNVTLNGNPVEFLVNGRKSLLLSGDNRSAALKAMPSNMLSAIEVMSNPGAQISVDGAAGVINIVTRSSVPDGYFGSASGQLMSKGGVTANTFASFNKGKLAATFSAGVTDEDNDSESRFQFLSRDQSGASLQTINGYLDTASPSKSGIATATFDYGLTAKDSITAELSYLEASSRYRNRGQTSVRSLLPNANSDREIRSLSNSENGNRAIAVTWTRAGTLVGTALRVSAKLESGNTSSSEALQSRDLDPALSPATATEITNSAYDSRTTRKSFGIDYNRDLGEGQVAIGVSEVHDDARQISFVYFPNANGASGSNINPELSTPFSYDQSVQAVYGTYQMPVGSHWVVLVGARHERFEFQSFDFAARRPIAITQENTNPSLFSTYVISENKKLRFNISKRLQRPSPSDLNPSTTLVTTEIVRAGAPALKPQITHAYEAIYERTGEGPNYSLRAFYLQDRRSLVTQSRFIDDPQNTGNQILELTRKNTGSGSQAGLQFTHMGNIRNKYFFTYTLTPYTRSIHNPDLIGPSSVFTGSAQVSVSYMTKKSNSLSVNLNYQGKDIMGDGYVAAYTFASASYVHKLAKGLDLTINLNNLFNSQRTKFTRDTLFAASVNTGRTPGPVLLVGLTKSFGSGAYAPQ